MNEQAPERIWVKSTEDGLWITPAYRSADSVWVEFRQPERTNLTAVFVGLVVWALAGVGVFGLLALWWLL